MGPYEYQTSEKLAREQCPKGEVFDLEKLRKSSSTPALADSHAIPSFLLNTPNSPYRVRRVSTFSTVFDLEDVRDALDPTSANPRTVLFPPTNTNTSPSMSRSKSFSTNIKSKYSSNRKPSAPVMKRSTSELPIGEPNPSPRSALARDYLNKSIDSGLLSTDLLNADSSGATSPLLWSPIESHGESHGNLDAWKNLTTRYIKVDGLPPHTQANTLSAFCKVRRPTLLIKGIWRHQRHLYAWSQEKRLRGDFFL